MDPQPYLAAIEQELVRSVDLAAFPLQMPALFREFLNMHRYHLGWTDSAGAYRIGDVGKRLRPLLLLWSCQAVGGRWQEALPAAAAVELVHNFSLIHDDIEDNSAERRGRVALWRVWGLAHGINAGDAMFALARTALDRLQVELPVWVEVHRVFDTATLALTQGQYLDLSFESREAVSVAEYEGMVRGKTAALLSAAAEIGARTGRAENRVARALAHYGENLGIAFQIADDVLGLWGDPAVTGKPAGDDLYARKKSLPVLAALETDTSGQLSEFLKKPKVTGELVDLMLELIEKSGARERAERAAEDYLTRAIAALAEIGEDNEAVDALRDLTRTAVRRDK